MKRCAEPRVAARSGNSLPAIFSSARARPSGLRVNSTAVASAWYSRRRDTAIASRRDRSGVSSTSRGRTSSASGFTARLPWRAKRLRRAQSASMSVRRRHRDHRRDREVAIGEVRHPCAMTPRVSSRSSRARAPAVTAMAVSAGAAPAASAGDGSGMTKRRGAARRRQAPSRRRCWRAGDARSSSRSARRAATRDESAPRRHPSRLVAVATSSAMAVAIGTGAPTMVRSTSSPTAAKSATKTPTSRIVRCRSRRCCSTKFTAPT